jgi:serine/threonine protein kinase/outer membrane protein assembly factor BamB
MVDRVGQQFGDYRLIQNLGSGGFADVYLGEHIYLGTKAAVKVLKGAFAEKDINLFLAEAKTIVSLEHPHIVHVITFSVAEINSWRIPFLVLEYAANGTLRQRHPKGVPLPLETILPYVRQITDALQYAHDKKFIHRDIKPENMLLGRHNEVLLSDFGIALTTPQSGTLTTQEMAGTVAYIAPEQIKGHPRPASDQYSLGVIVYEWLCGERPFVGPPWEVINKHFYADPPPLRERIPTLSPAVEQAVLRALAKEPQQRFPTVQEFANALVQADEEATTLPAPRPVNRPIPAQPATTPPAQVAGSLNQAAPQQAPVAPGERAVPFPTAQIANPVNQAAPQSAPVPPTRFARPTNQAPVQPASPASPQPIPRKQIQDTSLPANAYATIQVPSSVRPSDVSRPGGVPPITERKRGPAGSRIALIVGLAILVVVASAGFLLIPLLTRGTATAPTHPGTKTTTTTNPVALATSNGTMFGFDLQRTHFNPYEHTLTPANVSGLVPDWTFTTGGFVDSSPTVANGIVYVGSDDHRLYAFKASGCGNASCSPLWTSTTGGPIRSSPAVANGIVYIGSEDGKLYAFNAATGKTVWIAQTESLIYFSSPAVSGGTVYIGSEDTQLYALDAATGKLLWTGSTGGMIFSSPAVANGIVYVGSSDGKLYAFKAAGCGNGSCSPFWTASTKAAITYSSPAVANGMVYIGSDDHNLYAFNATGCGQVSCPPVWMASAGNVVRSSPTVANGVVYVGSDDGKLYAFNAASCGNASCAPLWMVSTAGHIFSSPVLANGVVYVGSQDSKLYAFHLSGATP